MPVFLQSNMLSNWWSNWCTNSLNERPLVCNTLKPWYLPGLTSTYRFMNEWKEIPESFEKLMYLLKFDVSGNQITQLPHTFINLPYLAELNISGNELWELPEDFGRLAYSLVNLNVSNNKLDKLPVSIGTLTRCKSMDFSNNKKGFQNNFHLNQFRKQNFLFKTYWKDLWIACDIFWLQKTRKIGRLLKSNSILWCFERDGFS